MPTKAELEADLEAAWDLVREAEVRHDKTRAELAAIHAEGLALDKCIKAFDALPLSDVRNSYGAVTGKTPDKDAARRLINYLEAKYITD